MPLSVADAKVVEKAIRGALEAVIKAEPRITEYDTVLGDGDCGLTLKTAALGNYHTHTHNRKTCDSSSSDKI